MFNGTSIGILSCLMHYRDLSEDELKEKFLEHWPANALSYQLYGETVKDTCDQISLRDCKWHLDTEVENFSSGTENFPFVVEVQKKHIENIIANW